jgi:type I restriction enzyme S subunit
MEKIKNIPSLRFSEFEGEWELKKLGDIGDVKMCRRVFNDETLPEGDIPFFKIGSFGKIADAFITKQLFLEYREKFSYPKKRNVLISAAGTIGRLVIYNGEDAYYQDSNIVWIDNDETLVNEKYLYYILQLAKFNTEGGTIQRLYNSILKSTKFSCSTLNEQTKIASFLTTVDDKSQTLKQKKTLLEQYKKGVMQKIFSQEIRFKDDNGNEYPDWEVRKLGEIFYSEKGKGISKNKIVPHGNFECVLYGELYTKYNEVIYNVVSKTNEVDGIKSKVGDLLIPSSTTTTGIDLANVTALNKNDVLLGGDITVLRSNNEINNVFYAYYLSNYKKEEIASYAQGSTIVHLYYSHIKDMEIHLLSLSEQTKIANFLSAIDDKINHCREQIANTEVWKKGLLQQMFV